MNYLLLAVVALIGIGGYLFLTATPEPTTMEDEATMNEAMGDETMDMMNEEDTDMQDMGEDIVATAMATENLSTLVTAVSAAGLVETLQGSGPFTVFAPTNAAFAALPDGTLDTLLMEENQSDLQEILTYHVVPQNVMAADLTDGMVVETVNGGSITINVNDEGVSINGGPSVIMADVETSNGTVHIIDGLLLP